MDPRRGPTGRVHPTTPCVLHVGNIDRHGYGLVKFGDCLTGAHRRAWILANGDPGDLTIDHLCEVKTCVRVDHLQVIPRAENVRLARTIACCKGHPWTEENTIWDRRGARWPTPHRKCRTCRDERVRARRRAALVSP